MCEWFPDSIGAEGLGLKETVRGHLRRVEHQLDVHERLRLGLIGMLEELDRLGDASIEQLINATEMTMIQVRLGRFDEYLEREALGSVVLEEDADAPCLSS